MKLLRVLLPVLVFGIMALAPHAAYAATANFLGPIVPEACHCDAASNGGVQSAPDFGCVLQVIENLMNFAISIGVVIFVLVAAYAGLLWMFSPMNPHNRELGRSVLLNAVIGLLIALSAWLLVDFVMKTLYNGRFGPWNEILGEGQQCLAVITPPSGPAGGGGGGGLTTGGGSSTNVPAANSEQENSVRTRLSRAGISINAPDACPNGESFQHYLDRTGRHCTTVGNLLEKTIAQAVNIAHACGGFQITAGTESGHAAEGTQTHGSGQKIDAGTGLSSCLEHNTNLTRVASPSFGSQQYRDTWGNIYTLETNPPHWDIYVNQAGPI